MPSIVNRVSVWQWNTCLFFITPPHFIAFLISKIKRRLKRPTCWWRHSATLCVLDTLSERYNSLPFRHCWIDFFGGAFGSVSFSSSYNFAFRFLLYEVRIPNCFSGDVEGEILFHFFLSGLIFAILPLSVYYFNFFVEETTEYLAKPFAETYTRRQVFEGLFLSLRRKSCFTVANCRSKTALLSRLEFLMTSDHKGTKCR